MAFVALRFGDDHGVDVANDILAALDDVSRNAAVRALVLTGNGKGFCAGGDIKGMQQRLAAPAGEVAINGWRRQQRMPPRGFWSTALPCRADIACG